MRRAVSSSAALLAVIVLLAGCGEKDEPEVTGPVVPLSTTESTTTSSPGPPQDPPANP